jgi:hypothetical protein
MSGRWGSIRVRLSPGASFRAFRFFQHGAGLLRVARPHQHRRQRMQCVLEFLVIVLAQRRLPRSVQYPVQFVKIHIDTSSCGFHPGPMSSSRNRFANGYPRTVLIDRFGT